MKNSPLIQSARWWIAGLALALAGVIAVRVAAPRLDDPVRAAVSAGGQLLALAGLVVIAFGVHRRAHGVAGTRTPADE